LFIAKRAVEEAQRGLSDALQTLEEAKKLEAEFRKRLISKSDEFREPGTCDGTQARDRLCAPDAGCRATL
jgi:hypothetical protein